MLPLVTVVDNSVLICHGGVSDITDLNYINDIPRHKVRETQGSFFTGKLLSLSCEIDRYLIGIHI